MGSNISSATEDGSKVEWERKPFEQGAMRQAHIGRFIAGPRTSKKCVVKIFKEKRNRHLKSWRNDLETVKAAIKLAESFNADFPELEKVYFPMPFLINVKSTSFMAKLASRDEFKVGDIVSAEPFLHGKWQKFNSNSGWEMKCNQIPDAFSHYTYVKTNHRAIVCDIQGVKDSKANAYFLTDPAINSYDSRFGYTDLGKVGITNYMARHQCNNICIRIGLNNPVKCAKIKPLFQTHRSTTYRN